MKKRHILFVLTALVLLITTILPAFALRASYEQKHKGYVTALELNDTATLFDDRAAYAAVLKDYKASGVTTAVLREHTDGSFDTALLDLAKAAGLDTALAIYVGDAKSLTYEKNLSAAIEKYEVKYLILKAAQAQTNDAPLASCIQNYNLTLVLCENENQLSNECPPGFENYVTAANGRIMRCYETNKTQSGRSKQSYDPLLIYYQMLNSARDRNTEFLLINQITDAAAAPEENAKITQNAIAKFCAWMDRAGYTPGFANTLAGYSPNLKAIGAAGAFLGVLMLLPMLYTLRGKSDARLEWILFALAVAAYAVTWLLPLSLVLLYPTLFAPLGACFSLTVCYAFAQRLKSRFNNIAYTCAVLAVGFVSLLACCVVLAAMLSGMEYYLNIYIFRGVSLTLLVPVVYALLLMYLRAENKSLRIGALKQTAQHLKKQIRPWHIFVLLLMLVVLAVYLLRSGNTTISALETKIRNVIGEFSMARPRTKEFLIGWPALALFAYYLKQNRSRLLTWVFAAGSSILFASVMNTFCHVFTDVATSVLRTVNGLAFAIPFLLLFTAANRVLERFFFESKA